MTNHAPVFALGSPNAQHCYYLPTPPLLSESWHIELADAIPQLITLNGNHWRKIFTIMAKLSVIDGDWKNYRDSQLLKHNEQILVGSQSLSTSARLHIIIGSVSANTLKLSRLETSFTPLDAQGKVRTDGSNTLLCPYLDYRQFPNALIEQTRKHMLNL